MNRVTQAKRILNYLRQGHSLTPLEALDYFQCFRLGARIWELKQIGHDIVKEMVKLPSGKYVAEYRLRG